MLYYTVNKIKIKKKKKTTSFYPNLQTASQFIVLTSSLRVHLHIVFVLLYSVSVSVLSFVLTSFDLLRMCYVL